MAKSSSGNSYPEHVAAADRFAAEHPGKQPFEVYGNGDHYQRMTDGWIGCLTLPGGVLVLAAVVMLVVLL